MNTQPNEIILFILNKLPAFDQIRIFMIVCKRWYSVIKNNHKKIICDNFEDFILNDYLHLYPTYAEQFNNFIYFLPSVCDPNSNLYKLIDQAYRIKKIGDIYLLTWVICNNYLKIIKKLCQRINIYDFFRYNDNPAILVSAIENNYFEMVKYIFENIDLTYVSNEYFRISAQCNNIKIIDYFFQKIITLGYDIYFENCNIDTIEYLFRRKTLKNISFSNMRYMDLNFFTLLFPLLEKYDDQYNDIDFKIIKAIMDDDLQTIINIHSGGYNLNKSDNFMMAAAKLNRLNIIKYICKNCEPGLNLICDILKSEPYSNNLNIYKYLYKKYSSSSSTVMHLYKKDAIKFVIYANNFNLVKFLFDCELKIEQYDGFKIYTPNENILPILKYIYISHPEVLINPYTIIKIISSFGDQTDLDYFQINNFDNIKYYKNCLNKAIVHNNYLMIKKF